MKRAVISVLFLALVMFGICSCSQQYGDESTSFLPDETTDAVTVTEPTTEDQTVLHSAEESTVVQQTATESNVTEMNTTMPVVNEENTVSAEVTVAATDANELTTEAEEETLCATTVTQAQTSAVVTTEAAETTEAKETVTEVLTDVPESATEAESSLPAESTEMAETAAEESTGVPMTSDEVELSISMPEKNGTMVTDKNSDNRFIKIVNGEKGIDTVLLMAVYSVPESGQNYVFEFYDENDFSAGNIRRVYLIDRTGDITSVAASDNSEKENISPVENWFCMNVLIKEIIYPAVTGGEE